MKLNLTLASDWADELLERIGSNVSFDHEAERKLAHLQIKNVVLNIQLEVLRQVQLGELHSSHEGGRNESRQ